MADLQEGESIEMQGSGSRPYVLKNVGGVYSCSCPAWRNQSIAIETRTCKHLRKLRGDEAEAERTKGALPARPAKAKGDDEPDKAPPLLLAESWDGNSDHTGWWLSEKLDGVRAYWDGAQFLSRLGNKYHAPEWFTAELPAVPLDGELWLGRKAFQRTVSIARRQDRSDHWKELTFLVFDAPTEGARFEDRMKALAELFKKRGGQYARAHEQVLCQGRQHLLDELARVESVGGEGLMLRQPGSLYVAGRSTSLLKVKQFQEAEARVLEHQAGTGRHKGRLGALLVELADGTRFAVGTGFSDRERESPPSIGTFVTCRYQELSDGGVPRFPSFVRVRTDLAAKAVEVAASSKKGEAKKGKTAAAKIDVEAPAAKTSGGTRRFTFADGKSDKFWEVTVAGKTVTVRYGRTGTNGQTNDKEFSSADAAVAHVDKLIAEKLGKGYREDG